ncbi:MAG: tripartite tricarboxylate transporter substrate binding protein [Dehalobacterium sp.]
MMFYRKSMIGVLLLMFLAVGIGGCAGNSEPEAQSSSTWPEKEIHFIWHSKAGSSGDILLRNLGSTIEQNLGKPVVVENREGAGGYNAWDYLRKAAPDGYTFGGIAPTFLTSMLINKMDLTPADYEPVAVLFIDPLIIYCRADGWENFDDFVAYVKEHPGEVKIAGGTPGNIDFMVIRDLREKAGLDIKEVPFEGGGEAPVAVVGKHLDIGIGEYGEIGPMVESGKLKILASFNPVPGTDIKTIQDYGYNIKVEKFRAIVAPKDTPREIIDQMYQAIVGAFQDENFIKYYETSKMVPYLKGPEEAKIIIDAQYEQIKAAVE